MIRVLHSVPVWLPQTEYWLYEQIRSLPKNVASLVLCESLVNAEQFPGPEVRLLQDGKSPGAILDAALRRLRLRHHFGFMVATARDFGANVLHSHFGHIGWRDVGAARRARLKHVVTFYGFDVGYLPRLEPRWRNRYQILFDRVDLILCEGPRMAEAVAGLGCPSKKIRVHHLGVRVSGMTFRPRVWQPGEVLRVLIAASFREKKGIPYGLRALGRLQRENPIEITIIGDATSDAPSQRERQKILAALEEEGLLSRTRLLGYQSHQVLLNEAYSHHVFLSPSLTAADGDSEGGAPITIIEMAATGMPVVATTHCDIPNVLSDGLSGLLARERDIEGLVQRLEWLVRHPDQWREIAAAARAHIERHFDVLTQSARLAAIYEQI